MVSISNHITSVMEEDRPNLLSEVLPTGTLSPPMIRSVAMSANIANTVQDEVKHLIKVNHISPDTVTRDQVRIASLQSEESSDSADSASTYSANHKNPSIDIYCPPICSHVLPNDDDSIVYAIVLSRWDDIIGPRTIRVWLPEFLSEEEDSSEEPVKYTSPRSVKAACQFSCSHQLSAKYKKILLMKAIKYVTSHTVNYTSVTGASTPDQNSNALFVVPDLDMVAQSLIFHVPLSGSTPYSLALIVNFSSYLKFLPLRKLCQHWLERLSTRLAEFLLSVSVANGSDVVEFPSSTMVDLWMIEMCNMLMSLEGNGLGQPNALQSHLSSSTLGNPVIERALTSHLQTSGCTIVMGNNVTEINSMISFLALFLDEEARCCSRLVQSGQRYTFQIGLYVQGLLLDEFGCRDLSSEELLDNPFPVTWVDLSKSAGVAAAVRQGLLLHHHLNKSDQSENVMRVFKGESIMVRELIRDLRQLPPSHWNGVVALFVQQLQKLALTLLSVVHWNGVPSSVDHRSIVDNPTVRHLCATLLVDEATLLMILVHADKLRPGIYRLVMEGSLLH